MTGVHSLSKMNAFFVSASHKKHNILNDCHDVRPKQYTQFRLQGRYTTPYWDCIRVVAIYELCGRLWLTVAVKMRLVS